MSLLVILLILLDEPLFSRRKNGVFGMGCEELLRVAQTSLLLALLSLLFAYAAGCSREFETSGYVFALAVGVVLYIAIHVLLSYSDKNKKTPTPTPSTDDQSATANATEKMPPRS
jgi:hypothetical protein